MSEDLTYQEISLPLGKIIGCLKTTIYDATYYNFEGIPYAQPPVGDLRFKSPLPAKPWTGVKDCFEFNLKPLNSNKPLPVMVWIYGGEFMMGEATKSMYSPDYLMKEDIVVVTLNYRVHSFCFLSVEDPEMEIPGNAGLKDQVLALKWIKQYIKYFNGDPENITVFGYSAGSASVHYLTATKAKGLFHKVICRSGSMFNFCANNPPKDRAYRLAVKNGYMGINNDRKIIEYLRTLEPHKVVQDNIMSDEDRRNGVLFTFCPCVEPYESEDCVIPQEPREMLKTAWGNDIPLIIGGCIDEGLLYYPLLKMAPETIKAENLDFENMFNLEIKDENKEIKMAKASKLIKAHFGDKIPSEECMKEFVELCGFKAFWHGFYRTALSRLAYAKAPTYFYRFSFESPTFHIYRDLICGRDLTSGVSHVDDMADVWYSDMSSKEYKFIEIMVDIFTTFAKTLNPNCFETRSIKWDPLDKAEPDMGLDISDDFKYIVLPEKESI